MVSPAQFLEEIEAADTPIGKDGYRMDGDGPDGMRRQVGLMGCHCCDYFITNGKSVVLIEETRLSATIDSYKKTYDYLRPKQLDTLTNDRIREENTLKVYGSLLVLCRLSAQCAEFEKIVRAEKYHFWLIASDVPPAGMITLEELQNRMFAALRSAFGKRRFAEIKIVPGDMLEDQITAYSAAS